MVVYTLYMQYSNTIHHMPFTLSTVEEMHCFMSIFSVSGCTDYYSKTEEEAFETSRDIVATFNIEPVVYSDDYDEPLFDTSDLLGLIPKDNQHTMDMNKVAEYDYFL